MKLNVSLEEVLHQTETVLSQWAWFNFCFHYYRHSTHLACQRQHNHYHTFGISCHTSRHAKPFKKVKRIKGGQRKRSRRKIVSPSRRPALPRTCDLGTLAMTENWLALTEQAPIYPRELSLFHPETRRLPIHHACCKPSLDVYCLRALIDVNPSTVQAQDVEHNTPLHLLLYHAAPNQDLLTLLLDAYPAAVTIQDSYGRSPLFHAIDNDLSLETINLLIDAENGVDAITTPCRTLPKPSEKKPIAILRAKRFTRYSRMRDSYRTPLFIAWDNILTNRGMSIYTKGSGPLFPIRGKRLEKAMMLLKAAYAQKCREEGHPTTTFRFFHAALTLHAFLPRQVIEYAISSQPMQIMDHEEGSKRNPLHILASIHMSNRTFQEGLVEQVLNTYPQAAERTDSKGQLPFHICLKSGKLTTSPIMHALYDAYPEACTCQDGMTGFYSFVLPLLAPPPIPCCPEEEILPFSTQTTTALGRRRNSFRREEAWEKEKGDQKGSCLPMMRRGGIRDISELGFDPSLLEEAPNEYETDTTIFELLLEAPECLQYIVQDLSKSNN